MVAAVGSTAATAVQAPVVGTLGRSSIVTWPPVVTTPSHARIAQAASESLCLPHGLAASSSVAAAAVALAALVGASRLRRRRSAALTLTSRVLRRQSGTASSTALMNMDEDTTPAPVWVINLDKSTDRWHKCSTGLASRGVDSVERFPATYGKELSEEELMEQATFGCRTFCTPGMIGCFLSHRRIWERVVAENQPAVVVLEDDAIVFPNFNSNLRGLLDELPEDWDVCLLGAVGCVARGREALHMKLFALGVGGWRASPGRTRSVSPRLFVPFKPAGTHAYIVSRQGAAKLLERLPRARYHVDLSAWSLQDLNLYAAKDFLATQDFDETSTVSKEGASRTQRFLRWCLELTGLAGITRATGAPLQWAWKVALFALPLPLSSSRPRRKVIVELGPASAVCVLICMMGLPLRSLKPVAVGLAYQGVLVFIMRWLVGTQSPRVLWFYVAAIGACLYIG
eukprot:CAMPEP_0115295842 /NCGR_PEP_ID=MMETSP0270-20121206/66927_1 /TAXON_ID=71861 /ORGANISM="Scrippsiella trochoidea, Strain CCMP3099" /LENGTH=455 /DNA_ID=CAMNT_0002713453 /DNA_START=60 /DNA_END=1427 /DNA_ORIENTATION=-